ncbi:hypothetical protein [Rhizobium sp. BK538]|uniref:hypothetical protein n=1 Tax=Rhizobium sp. BK538 TaxID=2586984 RepID=UPI001FEE3052|nr:hypothetical protein [Rhizobium sp. BK538]
MSFSLSRLVSVTGSTRAVSRISPDTPAREWLCRIHHQTPPGELPCLVAVLGSNDPSEGAFSAAAEECLLTHGEDRHPFEILILFLSPIDPILRSVLLLQVSASILAVDVDLAFGLLSVTRDLPALCGIFISRDPISTPHLRNSVAIATNG